MHASMLTAMAGCDVSGSGWFRPGRRDVSTSCISANCHKERQDHGCQHVLAGQRPTFPSPFYVLLLHDVRSVDHHTFGWFANTKTLQENTLTFDFNHTSSAVPIGAIVFIIFIAKMPEWSFLRVWQPAKCFHLLLRLQFCHRV